MDIFTRKYNKDDINRVVISNTYARRLYEGLGFKQLGTIPGGFRLLDGRYEDICPYFIIL